MATDVYRPAREGEAVEEAFPTLLTRTPYGKGDSELARSLAKRGYAVVVQDVRGRFNSEGIFYIYVNEGEDGYDAVEWAAEQPWSNGEVATYGGSYAAATQNALAAENPPHLEAMFVRVGTSNYYQDGAGAGGAFALLHNLDYALGLANTSHAALEIEDKGEDRAAVPTFGDVMLERELSPDKLGTWIRAYPYRSNDSPLEATPNYQKWFQDWVDNASYNDYWKQNGYAFENRHDQYPDIPTYFIGGWYDIFLHGTLTNYAGLSDLHNSSTSLLMGPWEHGVGPRSTGDVDFGSAGGVDIDAERLQWFDRVLKGEETGLLDSDPVHLFVMGGGEGGKTDEGTHLHGGEWTTVSDWPPPEAETQEFYLHADGTLSQEQPSASSASTSYEFDPSDPVPTIGGKLDSGGQLVPPGPWDQRCEEGKFFGCDNDLPLSSRRDVITFQTPPLEEDVVIAGPITVSLWVSSSARDTDFTAKLVDVHPPSEAYPSGYDMLLADRIKRMRHRGSAEETSLMEEGVVYEIEIDLLGTANRFKEGHRIRIDISSSNFPFFDVNPNTGERLGHHTHEVKAVNTIYHDAERSSHVTLPLMPTE
jgi:putative CocE/NonD family hydrolase